MKIATLKARFYKLCNECLRGQILVTIFAKKGSKVDYNLHPDWVEWLMGYPVGWTKQGAFKERLQGLGNAVVPVIPEYLGGEIISNE